MRGGLEKALHQHRRRRRYVVAELAVARELVGAHRLEHRVVLIDANAVPEVGAELGKRVAHALEDVLGFALETRCAEARKALGPFDLGRLAGGEIEGFMARQEEPRAGLDRVRVRDGGSGKAFDRTHLDAGHGLLAMYPVV
jgi:hypothetical protein